MAIIEKQVNFTLEVLAPPDIFLQISPLAAQVRKGRLAVFDIVVQKLNDFVGTVALSLEGLPGGVVYSIINDIEIDGTARLEIDTTDLPVTSIPPDISVPPLELTLTATATEA